MKYMLEPQNEGQDMNAVTAFRGSRRDALKRASEIASTIQAVLPGCSITCQVRTTSQQVSDKLGIIALTDGTFINGETGQRVRY